MCFQITILQLAFIHVEGESDSSTDGFHRPRRRCWKPRKEQLLSQLINATSSAGSLSDVAYNPQCEGQRNWNNPYFNNQAYNLCARIAQVDWTDGQSRPLNARSLCPWTVVCVRPPRHCDRFPRTIAEVRCICTRCQRNGSSHQCRPIYYPMIVLEKTRECDDRNIAIYRPKLHKVVVGCTCVDASES